MSRNSNFTESQIFDYFHIEICFFFRDSYELLFEILILYYEYPLQDRKINCVTTFW